MLKATDPVITLYSIQGNRAARAGTEVELGTRGEQVLEVTEHSAPVPTDATAW